jgi:hypothetical protein
VIVAGGARGVIERLVDDDYVHEQLGAGVDRLGAAYRRARTLRREEALQDRRLYDHVRVAAGSLSEAARRALGKPKPKPTKRRRRAVPAVLILVAVGALVRAMHRAEQAGASDAPVANASTA